MAHEISVTLRSDPSPYEAAIKRMSKATSEWELSTAAGADDVDEKFADVIRALVDMERQGGRTEADVVKALRGIGLSADDAQDAVKAIDRELDTVGKNDGGKKAADALQAINSKAGDVGDGVRSLGDVAKSALAGDFAGAASSALDGLGGLAAAAGVGGAVGGALTQALSGLVGAAIAELTALSEHTEQVTNDIIGDFVEFGDALDSQAISRKVKEIFGDEDTRRQADLLASLLKVDLSQAALAMAGDFEAAGVTVADVTDAIAEAPGNVNYDDWLRLRSTLSGTVDGLEQGPRYADAMSAALSLTTTRAAEAAVAAGDATKEIDEFGDAIYRMPDGKVVYVDAETGQATTDMKAVEDKQFADKTVWVHYRVDDREVQYYEPPTKRGTVVFRGTGNVASWE